MLLDEELRILLLRLALCLILDAVVLPPLLPCGFVVMPVLFLRRLWRLRSVVAVVALVEVAAATALAEVEVAAAANADAAAADVVASVVVVAAAVFSGCG